MAVAFVQRKAAVNTGTGTATSCAAASHTTGNCIVAAVSVQSATAPTVTDTAGNTYTDVGVLATQGTNRLRLFVAKNITGNASNVVTANISPAANGLYIAAYEFSGVDTTTPVADSNTATGTGPSVSSPSLSIGTASSAAVVGVASLNSSQTATGTNGYTAASPNNFWFDAYHVTTSSEALTATTTATPTYGLAVVMVKAASGGSAPANTVAPAVTGTATVGSTLTTDNGTWSNTPTSYSYQWQRDNTGGGTYSNITSATSSSYTLVDADDGCNIRCVVTATNASGSASANSNALGAVVEPVATNSAAPVASGTAQVNATVSATTGTWTHMGGSVATYAYQWQDSANGTTGWANIVGATSSNYTIAVGELNKYLRCNVTATNTGGTSSATSSNVLGPVAAASASTFNLASSYSGAAFLNMKGIR